MYTVIANMINSDYSFTDNFFSLGPLLERVGPQRKSISRTSAKFDEKLKNKMGTARNMSKRDPALLDKKFPWIPFDSARPACFAYFNLLRVMVTEASQLKEGDGMDFCHAVMGSAYASFATLDQHWKRRVQSLPKPNGLARIYSGSKLDKGSELDKMVMDIESWVARRAAS